MKGVFTSMGTATELTVASTGTHLLSLATATAAAMAVKLERALMRQP